MANLEARAELNSGERVARAVTSVIGWKAAYTLYEVSRRVPRFHRFPIRTLGSVVAAAAGAGFIPNFLSKGDSNIAVVEAADPDCNLKSFTIYGFAFIDNPVEGNRRGLIDPKDYIVAAPPRFGEIMLTQRADVKDPNSTRTEVARANMVVKDDHGEITIPANPDNKLTVKANTKGQNGKSAAQILVSAADDKVRQKDNPNLPVEISVTVECDKEGVAWIGRVPTEEALDTTLKHSKGFQSVGQRIDELMARQFGANRTLKLTPQSGVDQAANLKNVKDNEAEVKKDLKAIREKERNNAGPKVTITPTGSPTSTPISTATATITATVRPTEAPTAVPTVGGKGKNIEPDGDNLFSQLAQVDMTSVGMVFAGLTLLASGGRWLIRKVRGS